MGKGSIKVGVSPAHPRIYSRGFWGNMIKKKQVHHEIILNLRIRRIVIIILNDALSTLFKFKVCPPQKKIRMYEERALSDHTPKFPPKVFITKITKPAKVSNYRVIYVAFFFNEGSLRTKVRSLGASTTSRLEMVKNLSCKTPEINRTFWKYMER